uniref:Histone deacetylase n=1 Tax=Heterorhabditis bacteriophora TaxID=37862 RepID=A0A1I7XUM9_HETBA
MGDEDGSDADNPETGHAEVPRRLRVRELAKSVHPALEKPDSKMSALPHFNALSSYLKGSLRLSAPFPNNPLFNCIQ